MRMQRNFYEVLGVPRNASRQDIKSKYHSLARQYHPDRAKDKELADRLFVQINRAYSTLNNDVKRAQYDASLEAMDFVSEPSSPQVQPRRQAPVPATAQEIREWFEQASRLQLKGELARAISICSKVIEVDPNNYPGLSLMGDLLAQSGRPSDALQYFERAAVIQPGNRMLRDKIARLSAVNARRTTNPGVARPALTQPSARPAPGNIVPPTSSATAEETKRPASAPEPGKSLFDRLMHRK